MPKATSNWMVGAANLAANAYAAKRIYDASKSRYNKYRGKRPMNGRNRGRVTSGQGITVQHDRATTYRRKRAPQKVRRRARRSMRSFKSKILKMKGHRTFFTNSSLSVTSPASGQSVKSWVLFGGKLDGAVDGTLRGYDDMNDMRRKDYLIGDSTGDAQNRWAPGDTKWYLKTGVMDITIQNTDDNQVPIEMDIYEFTVGVLPSVETTAGGQFCYDVESAIQFFHQDTYAPGTTGAGMALYTTATRGVTPFEFGGAMAKMRMKILKKTKYFIPFGDTITYLIRDTKIRTMNHSVFRNNSVTTRSTRGILIIAKPTIASAVSTCKYTLGCSRKYKYVVDESNTDRAARFITDA